MVKESMIDQGQRQTTWSRMLKTMIMHN